MCFWENVERFLDFSIKCTRFSVFKRIKKLQTSVLREYQKFFDLFIECARIPVLRQYINFLDFFHKKTTIFVLTK